MVTSCPSCATTFRVSHDQLKARQGKVRCGKCETVFDAFKTLASLPDEPLPEPSPVMESYAADGPGSTPVQATLDIGPALAAISAPGQTPRNGPKLRAEWIRRNGFLIATALALSAGFLLQLLYALRAPLTSSAPALRPMFEWVCIFTGCTLELPRRTEALAIESSDLQADPVRVGVIVLAVVLRNRGPAPVEYPALELTLTNSQEQAVARRIFLPRDYLESAADVSRGMGALAEINVRLELDTGELKPAGYRLFLFYP